MHASPQTNPQSEEFIRLHQERFKKEPAPEDIRLFESLGITPEQGIGMMEELHDFAKRLFDAMVSVMNDPEAYRSKK